MLTLADVRSRQRRHHAAQLRLIAARLPRTSPAPRHGAPDMHEAPGLAGPGASTTKPVAVRSHGGCAPHATD